LNRQLHVTQGHFNIKSSLNNKRWFFPDPNQPRNPKSSKLNQTDPHHLAEIHHRQVIPKKTQNWVTGFCRLAVHDFIAKRFLAGTQKTHNNG